ncbi:3-hydroxy-3-methylglutaryl-coenzyme A reductase 1-like [Cryptomeria japonica]|uniref:3-hydroxy-3-methylglutaryl-coenzyme A reductase 1-like n=1 Tax=Cryptomeria japonica TaxID=3369 RepID=UPI0025AD3C90|nr:3-hydroxy-3-methylglutaryl-coenzyme A reductase 1-like [Cryptomeria japonica]
MDVAGLRKSKMVLKGEVKRKNDPGNSKLLASDALLLPLGLTNKFFFLVFFASSYFLMKRWREKMGTSTPLHVVNFEELVAIVAHLSSFIYLLGFFGIDYVQNFISGNDDFVEEADINIPPATCGIEDKEEIIVKKPEVQLKGINLGDNDDADIAAAVCNGTVASYSLESSLGDCKRAASVRRSALEIMTGRSLDGLPLEGFDYQSILGQCCEMPVGYVQIPVGVAGPLLVNGLEYMVPMATTEGCLVASTNRGCKAILMSGGATSILLRDGMTRAPVVRFQSAKRAAELKFYIEDPANSDNLCDIFNR